MTAIHKANWSVRTVQWSAFAVALLSLVAGLADPVASSWAAYGRLIYTVDDAYIHMGMARSIADHGVYGVVPTGFSSASSSPLWTLLLALLMVLTPASVVESVAAVAGFLAAATVLWMLVATAVAAWAEQAGPRPRLQFGPFVALLACAAVLPWALGQMQLVLSGMEHGLHMAVTMAFGLAAAKVAARTGPVWPMLLLGSLMTVVRFESVAPVLVAASVFALQRRWLLVLGLLGGAAGTICAQGCWSLAHGEAFLPNSVLVKVAIHAPGGAAAVGHVAAAAGSPTVLPAPPSVFAKALAFLLAVVGRWGANLGHSFGVLVALVGMLLVAAWRLGQQQLPLADRVLVLLVAATVGAQTAMGGSTAAMERYQSYLAGFALLGLVRLAAPLWLGPSGGGWSARAALWLPVAALPLCFAPAIARETHNPKAQIQLVYTSHWLPAEFLAEAVPSGSVVIEDLGAIAWLRPKPLIDIFGLATHQVAKRVVANAMDAPFLDRFARDNGVVAALVRPSALPLEPLRSLGSRPKSWLPVGFIAQPGNPNLNQALGLFALDAAQLAGLQAALVQFRSRARGQVEVILASEPAAAGFPGVGAGR